MKLGQISARQKIALFFGIFLGILVAIIIGYLLAPTLVYDQWIWKYYWGPVVADATGHSVSFQGVAAQEIGRAHV